MNILCVTSREFYRIELVFGTGASFHLSYNVLKGNLGIYKNNSTSSGTLSQTPDVKNLLRRIDRRNVLSTLLDKGGRSERNNLDRRRSAKLTIPPSSDVRPLVYHSNRQALSTTLFRRGGLWATADTCVIMWLKIRGLPFKNRKNSPILCLPF